MALEKSNDLNSSGTSIKEYSDEPVIFLNR